MRDPDDTGWVRVSSSNIAKIRHVGWPTNKLFVQFVNGGGGYYSNVPRSVFTRMLNAASKGKFLHRVLRNRGKDDVYPYTRGLT